MLPARRVVPVRNWYGVSCEPVPSPLPVRKIGFCENPSGAPVCTIQNRRSQLSPASLPKQPNVPGLGVGDDEGAVPVGVGHARRPVLGDRCGRRSRPVVELERGAGEAGDGARAHAVRTDPHGDDGLVARGGGTASGAAAGASTGAPTPGVDATPTSPTASSADHSTATHRRARFESNPMSPPTAWSPHPSRPGISKVCTVCLDRTSGRASHRTPESPSTAVEAASRSVRRRRGGPVRWSARRPA